MKRCSVCGSEFDDSMMFCGACGNKLPEDTSDIICPSCNAINPVDSQFCYKCGNNLKTDMDYSASSRINAASVTPVRNKQKKLVPIVVIILLVFSGLVAGAILNNLSKSSNTNKSPKNKETFAYSNANVGDVIVFGSYEQDNDTSNGPEEIEWIVIEKNNNKALILSKYALDCMQFHTEASYVKWEDCSLHKWLNERFLLTSFNYEEESRIISPTYPADNTNDMIFILSSSEVNKYLNSDEMKRCLPTDYAIAHGARTNDNSDYKDERATCIWWLRSPGSNLWSAGYVTGNVVVSMNGGADYDCDHICVRPAMWINLE